MKIDALNWNILNCLQENARMSNAEIGRRVGISSPAVNERVKKMEDAGVITGYKTLISPFETGYQLKAIITLRAFMGKLMPFLSKVKEYDEVLNCYRITGNENIVMEVVLKNQKHLETFIDQLITYGETKTQIVLSHVVSNKVIKNLNHKLPGR
jgi:Lrp/AsnC family leucine-responsive transcriptional regulator